MPSAAARAETALRLREEAHALLAESGLFTLLEESFSDATVTGSAGYDLMVWRGIDIHLAVEGERWVEWLALGSRMAELFLGAGMPLYQANYINDWIEQPLGAGLYWGLQLKDHDGNAWKLDLWGWEPFDYAVRQARDFSLRTDLNGCDRDLILRLKTEARARENYYGVRVSAFDIYQFCIDGGGDSLSALELWQKRQQGR